MFSTHFPFKVLPQHKNEKNSFNGAPMSEGDILCCLWYVTSFVLLFERCLALNSRVLTLTLPKFQFDDKVSFARFAVLLLRWAPPPRSNMRRRNENKLSTSYHIMRGQIEGKILVSPRPCILAFGIRFLAQFQGDHVHSIVVQMLITD